MIPWGAAWQETVLSVRCAAFEMRYRIIRKGLSLACAHSYIFESDGAGFIGLDALLEKYKDMTAESMSMFSSRRPHKMTI